MNSSKSKGGGSSLAPSATPGASEASGSSEVWEVGGARPSGGLIAAEPSVGVDGGGSSVVLGGTGPSVGGVTTSRLFDWSSGGILAGKSLSSNAGAAKAPASRKERVMTKVMVFMLEDT